MQLFDECEKFVQSCDIEHKQLILMGVINSDYAKTAPDVHIRTLQFIFTNMVNNIASSGVIHLGI